MFPDILKRKCWSWTLFVFKNLWLQPVWFDQNSPETMHARKEVEKTKNTLQPPINRIFPVLFPQENYLIVNYCKSDHLSMFENMQADLLPGQLMH